jgi:signal transduction histidine kinase
VAGVRRFDLLVFAVVAAVSVTDLVVGYPSSAPTTQWLLVGAATLLTLVVRRWSLVVLALECTLLVLTDVLVPTAGSVPILGAGIALALVAYQRSVRVTAAVTVGAYAFILVRMARAGGSLLAPPGGLLRLITNAMAVALPVVFARYLFRVQEAARLADQRAHDAEQRQLAEARAARLAERARIAGDLHDIVAHHVSAIALQAGSAEYAVQHTSTKDDAIEALRHIRSSASQTLVELRDLMQVLRDPDAVTTGDGPTVEPERMITDAVERIRLAGLDVEATVDERTAEAPLAARITAARVVQEALTNAMKHAGPGSRVRADVAVDQSRLRVEVTDSGPVGPRPELPASGYGLAGVKERVAIFGGTLTAGPDPAGGWRVTMSLPLSLSLRRARP